MAGIDNITSRILAEAQGEADALLAKAAEEAKGIIGEQIKSGNRKVRKPTAAWLFMKPESLLPATV